MKRVKNTMKEHKLYTIKAGFKCRACKRTWQKKPVSCCQGCPEVSWEARLEGYATFNELHKQNLKPTGKPSYYCHSRRGNHRFYYDIKNTKINIPELPQILTKKEKDDKGYLTEKQLNKINLTSEGIEPVCAVWYWDSDINEPDWCYFWDKQNCHWKPRDEFITKTQLKRVYLLSDSWIKRLGNPDKVTDNKRNKNSLIQLYSRIRIQNFLAENAVEYSEWLDKRDKYVAIFEINREKIEAARNEKQIAIAAELRAKRNQEKQCLQCVYGCPTMKGFLCTVHPMGLELDEMPCSDYEGRIKENYGEPIS